MFLQNVYSYNKFKLKSIYLYSINKYYCYQFIF